ncbi:hypothetical protein [Frankia sp. CiP3]|uniref:hypothetical protein n=1 Tax=Frankia sp. CiP3 TaxID=2880971 RepID=UPI001EF530CB|nr:hypothetical protein [Frankia sp. CiP3]
MKSNDDSCLKSDIADLTEASLVDIRLATNNGITRMLDKILTAVSRPKNPWGGYSSGGSWEYDSYPEPMFRLRNRRQKKDSPDGQNKDADGELSADSESSASESNLRYDKDINSSPTGEEN